MGRNHIRNRRKLKPAAAALFAAFSVLAGGLGGISRSLGPRPASAEALAASALEPSMPSPGLYPSGVSGDPPVFFTTDNSSRLGPGSFSSLFLDYLPPETRAVTEIHGLLKGAWDVEIDGSHMLPIRHTQDHINAVSGTVGYFVADGFSLNASLIGYAIDQPDDDAVAGGFDFYARWYFLRVGRLSFFADGGAGAIISDKAVPEGGTAFNFTPRGGVGIAFRVVDDFYFVGGARYWHLSNAGYHDISRNPSFDSVQYYGGVMFTF
jgi:hypothetical protein